MRESLQQGADPVQPVLFPGPGEGLGGLPLTPVERGPHPGRHHESGDLVGVHPQLGRRLRAFLHGPVLQQPDQLIQHDPAHRLRITPLHLGQQPGEFGGRGRCAGEILQERNVHPTATTPPGQHVHPVEDTQPTDARRQQRLAQVP